MVGVGVASFQLGRLEDLSSGFDRIPKQSSDRVIRWNHRLIPLDMGYCVQSPEAPRLRNSPQESAKVQTPIDRGVLVVF